MTLEYESIDTYNTQTIFFNNKYPNILSKFKQFYLLSNQNPLNVDYSEKMSNYNLELEQIETDLQKLYSDIMNNITKLYNEIILQQDIIEDLQSSYNHNTIKSNDLNDKYNNFIEINSNYTDMYRYNYTKNWSIFFSICTIGLLLKKK